MAEIVDIDGHTREKFQVPKFENLGEKSNCNLKYLRSLQPFWLKCKNLPKCTKFCSACNLEGAAKNFGLLTKNRLMHWQIYGGLKAAYQAIFVLYAWNFELKFCLWQ